MDTLQLLSGGDKVIMLHHGLFLGLHLLADLQALEMERIGKKKTIDDEILIQHIDYVSSLWCKDQFLRNYTSTVNPITDEYIICSSVLCISSMIFILGHEFGHVIEKHYSYDPANQKMNHSMEYQADKWGVKLLFRHMMFNGIPVEHMNYLLLSFFLTLGMIAMISNRDSITHPSAQSRLQNIKKQLPRIMNKEAKKAGYNGGNVMNTHGKQKIYSIGDKIFKKHIHYGNISRLLREKI